jgi:GTP-binding protein
METNQYHRTMVVSLIGRPNVGKSSLFNRLMRKAHKAITHDRPGVTRDRHYGIATFEELSHTKAGEAILVDTGGFYPTKINEDVPKQKDQIMNKFFNIMTDQAKTAIRESDLILFVVDSREGVLPFDQTIADYIRAQKKKFWVLVNKFDTDKQEGEELDFYQLGIGEEEMFKVSAEHGLGLLDLKQALHKEIISFEETQKDEMSRLQKGVTPREKVVARLALIGAPNAGKSTMLNLLLGSERALVSDIPGTTVDPIEGFFDVFFGEEAKLLEEDVVFAKTDNLLFQQYEEFRANNPDVYESLALSYNLEEEGTKGTPIYDEEDYLSEETPLYEEEVESEEINFDEAISDEELKREEEELEGELYETVFAVDDDANFDLDEDENEVNDFEEPYSAEYLAAKAQMEREEALAGSQWRSMHIVDTAGIRRQKAVDGFIEQQSVYRSLRCITESDIIIFMIDATIGISHQDRRLLDIALEKGKSVIVCLNKVDLLKDKLVDEAAKKEWISDLRLTVPWLKHCDLIPVSAKYNKHIGKLREAIKKTVLIRNRNIGTGKLNRYVYQLIESNPVAIKKAGKRLKVKYASMLKSNPPTFLFFSNLSKDIPDNYTNFLKNGLRKEFVLDNTPIHIIFRTGEDLGKKFGKKMREVN